ncbi:MAG: nucleotidyl transferase AbiEii/AbiGii toxin family protein [Chloroflexota bacterium]
MIDRGEIEAVSEQLGVHTSNVQRDYAHGWLLSLLYSLSPLSKQLVLKGGNALRKGYFKDGRYSSDLDFSSFERIPSDYLGKELNAICQILGDRSGIVFDTTKTRVEEKEAIDNEKKISKVRLYFRDFFGAESELVLGIRLDIAQFDRLYLPIQECQLIHPYSDIASCTTAIKCVKLEELLATKMRCLLQRRHIADLFDFVYATFINEEMRVNRAEVLSTFFKITIFGQSPGVAKGLFVDLPFDRFGDAWTKYIVCPQKSWFSFENAKDRFVSLIKNLIPNQEIRERNPVLFPSTLRNPIMDAGQSLTMLNLKYDGIHRLVEPYSLVFKVRKDGVGREYFYAYDTTGGQSSGPGIKAFLPGKVESIENTDKPFTPRMEVELSKAGASEIAGKFLGYRRRAIPALYGEIQVQCPFCQKKFKRKGFDTSLNPHKDEFGRPCPGRFGHPVWQ